MSQQTARINLSAKAFPLLASNWGRSVIVGQYDTNFNRSLTATEDLDKDVGIPQVYYMHNVMPHAQGFQSVGYEEVVAAQGTYKDFLYILPIKTDAGDFALLGVCSSGRWYIRESTSSHWTFLLTSSSPSSMVYVAYTSGITYIWQKGNGGYTYNFSIHALIAVTFTALDVTTLVGITTSYGYLVAWSSNKAAYNLTGVGTTINVVTATLGAAPPVSMRAGDIITSPDFIVGTYITAIDYTTNIISLSNPALNTNAGSTISCPVGPGGVFWSSVIDPTDFTPSLLTGAGGGEIQDAAGPVTFCVPHAQGFIVYTTKNAVGATYSQNIRYPFSFKSIPGSGGVSEYKSITASANAGKHFIYSTSGLQTITMTVAVAVLPEVTDFVSGKLFEDFDDIQKVFSLTQLTRTMTKQVAIVADRYLIISYGIDTLTHAIVVDLITNRFGKLRRDHVDTFEFPAELAVDLSIISIKLTEIPRENIALLQSDGSIDVVNFDVLASASNGTLLLGKYQFVRQRNIVLDEIFLENIYNPNRFNLTVMTSLNGKSYSSKAIPAIYETASNQQIYRSRAEGVNHSLLCQGQFHIESGVLRYHIGASR